MDFFTIENDHLSLKVNRIGAEITSLISKTNNQEFIWQGDKDVWANHAPVLFPIVGGLKGNSYSYKGQDYQLPRHGFARYNNDFILFRKTDEELVFLLKSSDKTKSVYPFNFEFEITYSLKGNEVLVTHSVINLSHDDMIFSIGGHPAFCFEESVNNYHLEFSSKESGKLIVLNDSGMRTNSLKLVDLSGEVALTNDSFNNNAWIIEDMNSDSVSLVGKNGCSVKLNQNDFRHFGIWSEPGAPFVCLEPWLGLTDHEDHDGDLENKSHTITLPSNKSFKASYSFEIETK